jgi:hypothetical protein
LESEQEAERLVEEMRIVLQGLSQLNSERERLQTILEEVLLLLTHSQASIASLEVSDGEFASERTRESSQFASCEHLERKRLSQRTTMHGLRHL